ncbi:MAG: hypothetical protein V1833_06110 [Elusimicrobiota bacterium]
MIENWTILPEFDEGHQNRYIVMVSARSVADDVYKKFPKICSQPIELKNSKYYWGLYVDNSTREERKNIYKFFLDETESEQKLKKEEEIKDVISELNNIFLTLTTDEQRHIKEEIPRKIDTIEKLAEKKEIPATPLTVDTKIAVSHQIPTAVPACESIKVGYLYPLSFPKTLEKFISQLKAITEKSMKIPIYLEKMSETGYNTIGDNDFDSMVSAAKMKKADVILAVVTDGIDDARFSIDIACRKNEILCIVAPQSQLDKKFLFIDIAIEMFLIKKKNAN